MEIPAANVFVVLNIDILLILIGNENIRYDISPDFYLTGLGKLFQLSIAQQFQNITQFEVVIKEIFMIQYTLILKLESVL